MSNPTSPALRLAAILRWIAGSLGLLRFFNREAAEFHAYVVDTLERFQLLLDRIAAGDLPPEPAAAPRAATPRLRPANATPRSARSAGRPAPRARPAPTASRPHRAPRAWWMLPCVRRPPRIRATAAAFGHLRAKSDSAG